MKKGLIFLVFTVFLLGGGFFLQKDLVGRSPARMQTERSSNKAGLQALRVPELKNLAEGPFKESVMRGKEIVENTPELLPEYVGGKISCTNCHLKAGTVANAAPWIGITARFPQFRQRSAEMTSLGGRINSCFERSMNGKRLPPESQPMVDMLAYMSWLSQGYLVGGQIEGRGIPKLRLDIEPDVTLGQRIYETKCASCHQKDGSGLKTAKGRWVFPPLWGKNSFNIGAGMARLHTAAGFVKHNMPLGQGGTLSDKEAWDVSAYFTRKPRPDLPNKENDWPKGGKPDDARY